jgi:superoxide dismutase
MDYQEDMMSKYSSKTQGRNLNIKAKINTRYGGVKTFKKNMK